MVQIEPPNRHDIHAVPIYRDAEIVGHVPYNLAPRMSAFFMETIEAKINRGADYGLKVLCLPSIWPYGPNVYVDKMGVG